MPDLRPLRDDDVVAAHEITVAAFAELDATRGDPEQPQPSPEGAHARIRHLMATDPGGCWAAVDGDDRPIGVALALVREGVWGLSLLVVRPDVQSAGAGGALLHAALGHGRDARGGVILGSSDPRALRAYHRAGFTMHPAAVAAGTPEGVEAAPGRRALRPGPRRRDGGGGRPRRPRRRARRGPRGPRREQLNCSRSPAAATSPTATARSSSWRPPTSVRRARCCAPRSPARAGRPRSAGSRPRSAGRSTSWSTRGSSSTSGAPCSCAATWGGSRPTSRVARISEPRPLVAGHMVGVK